MKNTYNVVFCGLDQKVFKTLSESSHLNLIAVNEIGDFLKYKTKNPIDYLFKWIYKYCKVKNNIKNNKIENNNVKNNDAKNYNIKNKFSTYGSSLFFGTLISFPFIIFKTFSSFSSKLYQQYAEYLGIILSKNIKIVDFEKEEETEVFLKNSADILVVSNWWLLSDEIIYAPKYKTINIHPSKLPQYRGSVPTLWSLKNKDPITAVSFMVLDSKMDSGGLISQYDIQIEKEENSISLENKADTVIRTHLVQDLLKYINGDLVPKEQNKNEASFTAKYYPYMNIDWVNESTKEIVNKIKLYPHLWPIDRCYTFFNNQKIFFKDAEYIPNSNSSSNRRNIYNNFKSRLENLKSGEFCIYITNFFPHIFVKTQSDFLKSRLFLDIGIKDSLSILSSSYRIFNYTLENPTNV